MVADKIKGGTRKAIQNHGVAPRVKQNALGRDQATCMQQEA